MAKLPTIETIERYKEVILSNPVTYVQQLLSVREQTRQQGELAFMRKGFAEQAEYETDEQRATTIAQVDQQIVNIGGQIDWLDGELAAHKETVEMLTEPTPDPQAPVPLRRAIRRNKAKK